MSFRQDGDVLLRVPSWIEFGNDDSVGEITINIVNGVAEMDVGFQTATIVSLFGGNYDDNGTSENPSTYWGNLLESEDARKVVSRTQHLLTRLPLTSANLLLLQEAVLADLQWMLSVRLADSIDVDISVPRLNSVNITVFIKAQGVESQFTFTENWKASV